MDFRPYTYNSHAINDGTNFDGLFIRELSLSPQTSIKTVRRAGAFPVYAGKEFPPHSFTVHITCKGTFNDQLETLMTYFDITDETPHYFIVKDVDDSDTQYQVPAVPVQFTPIVGRTAVKVVMSVAGDPVWKAVTQSNSSWSITTSGDTKNLSVGGNTEAYPIFEITPTSTPTNTYLYKRYITIYPNSANEWVDRDLEITNGGWDTATLVSGGKMQSDGDDLRVKVNGTQVARWLYNMNAAATKVWINLTMPPASESTLKTGIANTGTPSTIDITLSPANRRALRRMPKRGIVLINSEQFTYTDKTLAADELSLTVNARAVRGTSAGTHSVSDTVRWIPYDITVMYGNSAVSAPDTTYDISPVVELSSTNAAFTYNEFRETKWVPGDIDQATHRILAADSWKSTKKTAPNSDSGPYLSDHDNDLAEFVNPSEVLGMKIVSYPTVSGGYTGDDADVRWRGDFPDGVTTVTSSGYTYRVGSLWPAACSLESSQDGTHWVQEWNESSPGSASTWTAWTHSSESVPSGTNHIRFRLDGIVSASSTAAAKFEVGSATINLTNPPTVSLGSEIQIYNFDAVLKNDTTGDRIKIDYPTTINDVLTINCDPDNPTATIKGQLIYSAVGLDTTRNKWMTFLPNQTNTLSYTQAYTGNVSVTVYWNNRIIHL